MGVQSSTRALEDLWQASLQLDQCWPRGKMTKKDPKIWHRLLYRITGWDGMTPNTIFLKTAFDAELDKVRAKVKVPNEIPVKDDGAVAWALFGWFTMCPAMTEETDPAQHVFTKLQCCGRFQVGRREIYNNLD